MARNLRDGKANPAKVIAIWRTPPYHDYHWIAQPDLDNASARASRPHADGDPGLEAAAIPSRSRFWNCSAPSSSPRPSASDYSKIEQVGRQIGKIR